MGIIQIFGFQLLKEIVHPQGKFSRHLLTLMLMTAGVVF